jgi:hypothetical protein
LHDGGVRTTLMMRIDGGTRAHLPTALRAAPGAFTIRASRAEDEYVIAVAGELDLATSHLLVDGLASALTSEAPKLCSTCTS